MSDIISFAIALAVGCACMAAHHIVRNASTRFRDRAVEGPAAGFQDMFIFVDAQMLLAMSGGLAAASAGTSFLLSREPLVAVFAAGVALCVPSLVQRITRTRRSRRLSRQLPDLLMTFASGLRAGASAAQALDALIARTPQPLASELSLVMRKRRLGVSLEAALRELERRVDLPDYRLFVTTLVLAMSVGGSIAESLERLAATVLRRHVVEDKIKALTAQARLQAVVVTALPVALLAALTVVDPGAMKPMFTTLQGWWVLGVVVLLETCGWLLMRRIARIEI